MSRGLESARAAHNAAQHTAAPSLVGELAALVADLTDEIGAEREAWVGIRGTERVAAIYRTAGLSEARDRLTALLAKFPEQPSDTVPAAEVGESVLFADLRRLSPKTWREHRPVGAYYPVGQLDGDCKCGRGEWPCATVRAELAATPDDLSDSEVANPATSVPDELSDNSSRTDGGAL